LASGLLVSEKIKYWTNDGCYIMATDHHGIWPSELTTVEEKIHV
jgi:hypothetical protein